MNHNQNITKYIPVRTTKINVMKYSRTGINSKGVNRIKVMFAVIFLLPLIKPKTIFTTINNINKYLKIGTTIKIASKNKKKITAIAINCASIVCFVFTILVLQPPTYLNSFHLRINS